MKTITEFPRTVREIENIWIPMPDGIRLAARIWLPDDADVDPVPALLEYLPYRKRDGTVARDHLTHPYFAGHGYASVRVDMRGTGDSEGICLGEYLSQEQDDAVAVIEWLASQSWCSGKVGMIGISWGGFNGLQVAARQPAALAAVITLCSTDDRYADDIHFMGGCLLTDKIAWGATAFSIAHTPPDPAIVGEHWRKLWLQRLNNNGLWMLDWFKHQRRDEFYQHGSICEYYSAVNIPVYAVGGWADGYTNAIFRLLENLTAPCKGLIGPWAHKYPHFATPGPRIGFLQECLRWWDQHLKGIDTGIMSEPKLRAWIQDPVAPSPRYEQRAGHWVAETNWRNHDRQTRTYWLDGRQLKPVAGGNDIQVSSPQNAGWTAASWCGYGNDDDSLDQNGELGLMPCFESEPLVNDLVLLGFPRFAAALNCNQQQGNIVVVLSAVDNNNKATRLSYGVLNLTHHTSHTKPEALQPGRDYSIEFQLNAVGQTVVAGQRLRVSAGTSYWPVIWPSQNNVCLVLKAGTAKLDLPVRNGSDLDSSLLPFSEPECAEPLNAEIITPPKQQRTRLIDCVTGIETIQRLNDSGQQQHKHTGLKVQDRWVETFIIHPEDATSASTTCEWIKTYQRDDWSAKVQASVTVTADENTWHIDATLNTSDNDGVVSEKAWSETIVRDLV